MSVKSGPSGGSPTESGGSLQSDSLRFLISITIRCLREFGESCCGPMPRFSCSKLHHGELDSCAPETQVAVRAIATRMAHIGPLLGRNRIRRNSRGHTI